jgi:hypothetical protein
MVFLIDVVATARDVLTYFTWYDWSAGLMKIGDFKNVMYLTLLPPVSKDVEYGHH